MATRQSNDSSELERLRRRVRELEGQLRENNAESKEFSPQQATLDGTEHKKRQLIWTTIPYSDRYFTILRMV